MLNHYLDQGVSQAELSRRFGVNRRTIHYWIETVQPDRDLSAGARGHLEIKGDAQDRYNWARRTTLPV